MPVQPCDARIIHTLEVRCRTRQTESALDLSEEEKREDEYKVDIILAVMDFKRSWNALLKVVIAKC